MRAVRLARGVITFVVVTPIVAGTMAATAPASASACQAWTGVQPQNPGGPARTNLLRAAAITSACRAWAVGLYSNGTAFQSLIERWNGSAWNQVASPDPGGPSHDTKLYGVAATSAGNAWTVGSYSTGTALQTLVARWNGTVWTQAVTPNPGGSSRDNALFGVAAASAASAWAVGTYLNGTALQALILHWNGTAWKQVKSPDPGGPTRTNQLLGVAATSAGNAWAVGEYSNGTVFQTLILHWNGTAWKRVPSPNPGGASHSNFLTSVAVTSAGDAWAAGEYSNGTAFQTLILHWNGSAWKKVPTPSPGGPARLNELDGVAAISATNAVAVGSYFTGTAYKPIILHWNGSAWKRVASPDPIGPSGSTVLLGVGAASAHNVWAVGDYLVTASQTLAVHCC